MTAAATRVLLVEDSPSDADLLQQMLLETGADRFEFTWVDCLDDALARLGQASFDVLLLDLSLPDSAGPETFRRALRAAPQIPIVVLTGATDESLGLAAVQEGVQDYLVKGEADGRQIARSMRYAIERKHDHEQTRRAQETLRDSEARLRALLESAPQGIAAVDEAGRFVLVNAKIEEMFGYTRDELLGRPMEIVLPERYREAHAEHLRRYFTRPYSRVVGLGLDLAGLSKNGAEFPLEISLSCVKQGGSQLALALISDTTERKRAEASLRDAQKLESLGLLAGGVAHDFNNLLVGVIGNASLAREMLPPSHQAVELLDGVIETGEQAAHLTRQMLAYAGKGRFVVEALDLSALIPEMIGLVRPSISRKIELQLELEAGLPPIEADRGQIQQVFMNLALNASEAIGSRDGLIAIRTGVQDVDEAFVQRLDVPAPQPGRYVRLEVRDTGCGMDDATRAKIFDPFFSTKFTGRGLGLAAVAGIVRGHKAAIQVTSAPGKGSCFTVLFPASANAAGEPPAIAAHTAALRGSGVVLVVDDEQVVREMAKRALERQGYTVLVADSGLAAIDVFRTQPGEIALVVLDLSMPDMSGEETLPELRKIRPDAKALVSSGYSEDETMTLFRGQRISGFIQKPYTSTGLAEKVKACVGASA